MKWVSHHNFYMSLVYVLHKQYNKVDSVTQMLINIFLPNYHIVKSIKKIHIK